MPRFKYIIQNLEPVRIADNSSSQMGQTSSLHYIPGTAVRGAVVSALLRKEGTEGFEKVRKSLLSCAVRFSNAYPCIAAECIRRRLGRGICGEPYGQCRECGHNVGCIRRRRSGGL